MSTRGGRNGRGRGRGGRNSRGRGRGGRGFGRGRSSAYNPYHFASTYENFVAEAKMYPKDEWRNLTRDQQQQVHRKKVEAG